MIGASPCRIFPKIVPQGVTKPAVSYQWISGVREHAMVSDPGLVTSRIEFSAWAVTDIGAMDVIEQIGLALSRYSSGAVKNIFLDNEYDLFDEAAILHGRGLDVIVNHTEDT